MYDIYLKVCQVLGYEVIFSQSDIESNNSGIDELIGFMVDIEVNDSDEFILSECDRIHQTLSSLGYEV